MWVKEAVALRKKGSVEYVVLPKGTECVIVGGQYLKTKYGLLELTTEAIMRSAKYFSSEEIKNSPPFKDF